MGFSPTQNIYMRESHKVQFFLHSYTIYVWQIFQLANQYTWHNFQMTRASFYQCKFKHLPNYIHVLQNFLDQICDWFASWNIKINANKTEEIVFRKISRPVETPIKIQNRIIPYISSVKYLGLTLDSKLTFWQHTSKTISKTYFMLSVLYPFFKSHTLSPRIKVILYMAIIRSMLLYGCEAWSILADTHKRRFQVMQKKCLRIIFNAPRYTRNSDLHN